VLVEVGLGLRAGDRLLVAAGIDAAPLVALVTERAYQLGALNVDVSWIDGEVARARFLHGPDAASDEIPLRAEMYRHAADRGDSFLSIDTQDPALFADADPQRVARHQRKLADYLEHYRTATMSMQLIWCTTAAPSPAWARSVFPALDETGAIDRLWDAVFAANRVDVDDPVAAWRTHLAGLRARCAQLDASRYDRLRYAAPGIDLVVGLPVGHRWLGGAEGRRGSVPNLPTEEVFTAPDRMRVDGTVRVAKPLSYLGTIIEGIELRFVAGAVVEADARSGKAALEQLLSADEGSVRLGEAALVPQSSAVAAQNLVWRNTIYDENDACHLALGRAYPISVIDGPTMSRDDQLAAGLNHSSVHVDFVVGSPALDVFGVTADGHEEPVMLGGEWPDVG
jgi:aminopeptidase